MLKWLVLGLCLLSGAAQAQSFAIFQVAANTSQNNANSGIGINTQSINSPTNGENQAPINALNSAAFWQTATSSGGSHATGEEWNLILDQYGDIVSMTTGLNGSALTMTEANAYALTVQDTSTSIAYPGGSNSWELLWTGSGSFSFAKDVTATHLTCGSNCISLDVSATGGGGGGIEVDITATGTSSTVSFAGSAVTWTGSNFSAGTPVACQNGSGTLPAQITANTVYYVVSPSTNSFSLATTVGGSAISFTGEAGTPTCFGNWARNIGLIQTSQVATWNNGAEYWSPTFITFLKPYRSIRFMQMMNTLQNQIVTNTATFSGTTVTLTNGFRRAGTKILFQVRSGDGTLPSQLTQNTPYCVLNAIDASDFSIGTTCGGSAISFSGGSGSVHTIAEAVISDSDRAPAGYLFWGGPTDNVGYNSGPPLEAIAALCNEANADCWINLPPLSGIADDWQTSAATIFHNALHSNLKAYLEYGNEVWSFNSVITGVCDGIGNLLVSKFPSDSPNSNNVNLCYDSIAYTTTRALGIWQSVWGADAGRVLGIVPGQDTNVGYSQFIADLAAIDGGGSNPLTISSFTNGTPGTVNVTNTYSAGQSVVFTGTLPTGLTATTWAPGGGTHTGTITDYYVSSASLSGSSFQVAANKTDALNGVNSIAFSGTSGTATVYGTYWTGMFFQHAYALTTAGYFPNDGSYPPLSCTALSDGCRALMYSAGSGISQQLPVCTTVTSHGCTATSNLVTGNCGNGAGELCSQSPFQLDSASVAAGGSGYTNGTQSLTVLGGTCSTQPVVSVSVSGNAVTGVIEPPTTVGSCTVFPSSPASTSGGGGTSATLNLVKASGTFTVTTGLSLSCPPPNNTIIAVQSDAVSIASPTIAADGCGTASPLQNEHGTAVTYGWLSGNVSAGNSLVVLAYTSTVCQTYSSTGCQTTQSVGTPGWRSVYFGQSGGWAQNSINSMAAQYTNVAQPRGIALAFYEGGSNLSDFGKGDSVKAASNAFLTYSPEMGTITTQHLNGLSSTGGQVFNQYADIVGTGDDGDWGAKLNLQAPANPKSTALQNFGFGTACWWSGCGH